jgi:hypothetical protein
MPIIYTISGFKDYFIKDKILYRKSHKIRDQLCKWKYLKEREINRALKNGNEGYYLKGIFYSLKKLKHRLKKVKIS